MENLIPLRIACILILGGLAQAQTNPDLYDMPTAENVLKNVMGSDNIDTYAKQRAALYVLWDIAMSDIEKDYQFTDKPIKKVIYDQKLEYNNAMRLVYEKYLKEINRPENEEVKDKWRELWANYKYRTSGFEEEVIETLFSEKAKNQYYKVTGYQRPESSLNKTEDHTKSPVYNTVGKIGNPSEGESLYQTGIKYFYGDGVVKNLAMAKEFFEKASELNHSKALYSLGVIYGDGHGVTKNPKKALGYFLSAANLDHPEAKYYVASLYITGGLGVGVDYDKALQYYLLLVKNGVNSLDRVEKARVYTNIALIYINQDKREKALDFMKWVRRNSPNDINLEFIKNEANLYLQVENNKERFKVLLAEAASLDPDNADYFYNIGVVNMDQGNIQEARSNYKKALAIDPGYHNARLNLSTTYVNEGNELIDEINSLGNTQTDIARYNELKLRKDRLFREGAKILEGAIKYDLDSQELLFQLKNIYGALGDTINFNRINRMIGN